MPHTYYNEIDKKKCAALEALMSDGFISKGVIDDRSIHEVSPEELTGYDRCHFFAGVGLWDHALNLARWPEGRRVWTGSCPCQPFSAANSGQKGKADVRHLWPEWFRLIEESEPPTLFGEQVATAITKGWLDDVYKGLEAEGYAVGAAVLPACAVGAPHRRERLFFVANAEGQRGGISGDGIGAEGPRGGEKPQPAVRGAAGAVGDSESQRFQRQWEDCGEKRREAEERHPDVPSRTVWSGEWTACADGKKRLIAPGVPLLVDGYPQRVGIIHAAGDGIVAELAAEFIEAYLETEVHL